MPTFNIPEVSYDFSDVTFDWSITPNDKCKSREVEKLEHVSARVSAKIGLIYRLSHFLPSNQFNLIYTTLVQPIFDYGITLWGACCKTY